MTEDVLNKLRWVDEGGLAIMDTILESIEMIRRFGQPARRTAIGGHRAG